jgi:hypothetical protein
MAVYEIVPRVVSLSAAEARERGWDYHHPLHGWLRGGRKREEEAQENLGTSQTPENQSMREIEVNELRRMGGVWPPQPLSQELRWTAAESLEFLQNQELQEDLQAEMASPDSINGRKVAQRDRRLERRRLSRAVDALGTSLKGRKRLKEDRELMWRGVADRAMKLKKQLYTWEQVSRNLEIPVSTLTRWVRTRRQELG